MFAVLFWAQKRKKNVSFYPLGSREVGRGGGRSFRFHVLVALQTVRDGFLVVAAAVPPPPRRGFGGVLLLDFSARRWKFRQATCCRLSSAKIILPFRSARGDTDGFPRFPRSEFLIGLRAKRCLRQWLSLFVIITIATNCMEKAFNVLRVQFYRRQSFYYYGQVINVRVHACASLSRCASRPLDFGSRAGRQV